MLQPTCWTRSRTTLSHAPKNSRAILADTSNVPLDLSCVTIARRDFMIGLSSFFKQAHKFNYLGSLITSDGRCINEIKRRMAQAKASFQNMKSILTNKRLSLGVRKCVLQCYIELISTTIRM